MLDYAGGSPYITLCRLVAVERDVEREQRKRKN
jgi:hypothetical protein